MSPPLREPWIASAEVPADFVPFVPAEIEQSLADRFEAIARRFPSRPAILAPRASVSYAALNARANGISAGLLGASSRRDLPVGVLVGHGASQVAAIVGVLKAGRPYVGLDPLQDMASHRRTLAHCGADLLLCDAASRATGAALTETPAGARPALLDIDDAPCAPREDEPAVSRSADDLAYIYYTSGTTGVPKGVVDNQRNVLHNVLRYTNNLGIAPSDRLSLLQSVAFSGAVSSLFCALLNGAASVPVDLRIAGIVGAAEWLDRQGVTVYHSVPSIFERLLASGRRFATFRVIRLEGDAASTRHLDLFRRHFGPGVVLVNGLGATETGISHQFVCRRDTLVPDGVLPVGRPCPDMQGRIIDPGNGPSIDANVTQPVGLPPGSVGEVAVRSRYLALGYWRQPELTAARFLADPAGDDGARLYRTGDLGRYNADGQLELLGRRDGHLKWHGQWVEVQAIEAALTRHDDVREAAVMVREAPGVGSELVAYLVPAGLARPDVGALRRAVTGSTVTAGMAERAPGKPAPTRYVWLDALPLDANGKVQRHALPAPPRQRPAVSSPYAEPATPVEHALARIWCEALGLEGIGSHDDFSELGGQSLQALEIVARVQSEFGLGHEASRLLQDPCIAAMARRIDGGLS